MGERTGPEGERRVETEEERKAGRRKDEERVEREGEGRGKEVMRGATIHRMLDTVHTYNTNLHCGCVYKPLEGVSSLLPGLLLLLWRFFRLFCFLK